MNHTAFKIIISGGGTGGHIYPAISIANELKRIDDTIEILFVGANDRMEMDKVPEAGYPIIGLSIKGFQRRLTYKNFITLFKLFKSIRKSYKIIKDFRPDAVVGVGGFASGPLLYAATRKKIPTLIQEQNSFPGITNRILSKRVNKICVAYKTMEKYFPKNKIVFSGNPIRNDLKNLQQKKAKAQNFFQFNKNKKTLLVLGGSLGAKTINMSLLNKLDIIDKSDVQILWQTGKIYINKVRELTKFYKLSNVRILDYIDRMDYVYAVSDLVISRAGALTISELCYVSKPCILIPSPNVVEDHQTKNAMALVEKKAAFMVKDEDAPNLLIPKALELINNEKLLQELKQNIQQFAVENSSERIVQEIFKMIE